MSPLNLIMSPQDDDDGQRNRTHPCCPVVRVAEPLHLQERLVALREQTPLPQSQLRPRPRPDSSRASARARLWPYSQSMAAPPYRAQRTAANAYVGRGLPCDCGHILSRDARMRAGGRRASAAGQGGWVARRRSGVGVTRRSGCSTRGGGGSRRGRRRCQGSCRGTGWRWWCPWRGRRRTGGRSRCPCRCR